MFIVIMSVDKFGRHEASTLQARLRGPPGVGFNTTVEGDYNMSSKRLRMVGEPKDVNDATTVQYVNDNCLQLNKSDPARIHFDARKHVIRNLKEPVDNSDAVNKSYIDERFVTLDKDGWNFNTKRLVHVGEPQSSTDAVNKAYVDKHTPVSGIEKWDFRLRRLSNVADPALDSDGVNLSFLNTNVINHLTSLKETALTLDTKQDVYDAKGKCISNIRDPVADNDAVNLHIIKAASEVLKAQFTEIENKFEDEMSSLAYYLSHRLNDPLIRWAPQDKRRPWRRNFHDWAEESELEDKT